MTLTTFCLTVLACFIGCLAAGMAFQFILPFDYE